MHDDPWDGEGKVILQCWGIFSAFFSVRSHIIRDCLVLFLQHEAYSKAYDMYIDLLNERHKGELSFVVSEYRKPCWAQECLFMAVMIGAGVRTSAGSWELNADW